MKRISSSTTFIYKVIFPLLMFGFIAFILLLGFMGKLEPNGMPIVLYIFHFIMLVAMFFFFKFYFWNLMDEVWQFDTYLLIKKNKKEDKIDFKNIINISYPILAAPNRITIRLKNPSIFGKEISFLAIFNWIPFRYHKAIIELIEQVEKAKNG